MSTWGDVFEQSTDAVFGIDTEGTIRYTNSAFEQLLGYPADELCGCSCACVLCGTDSNGRVFCGPDCPIPKSVNGQPGICDFDLVVVRANGDSILVNIGASYIPHPQQAIYADVAVFFSMRQVNPQRMLQRMAMVLPKKTATSVKTGYCRLTSREKEVLALAADGMTTRQIASQLFIRQQTVRAHFKNIYPKLGVNSRNEAIIYALKQSLH